LELIRGRLEEIAASEGFSLSSSAAAAIAAAAEGSVRDALSLLDQLRAFASDDVDDEAVAVVLGVPPLEVTARTVEALGSGRAGNALAMMREQLAEGQDASVLYQEIGRTLRTLLHLAVDPALEPAISEAHRTLLQPMAETFGVDALSRMLGLWLEQEMIVRRAGNRELALEVSALRLARWPSVQRVEGWLAGTQEVALPSPQTDPSQAPPNATPGDAGGGSPPPTRGDGTTAAPSEPAQHDSRQDDDEASLAAEARSDPGVALALEVLGGEVVAVRGHVEGS
jgi:DNA polymerase-3 subunit gamma/tau